MTTCAGSGVPGDLFEHGHGIIPGTEQQMFRVSWTGKSSCQTHRRRCRRCDSTRYTWSKAVDFRSKAGSTHRDHAGKMVRKGLAATRDEALRFMNGAGVTVDFIAAMFADSLDTLCPGWCGFPKRHVITLLGDLQFDWRDPRFRLTRENCGPLCGTCNRQKDRMPWPEFMDQQHAIRMNLEQMVPYDPPLRLFDPSEFG